MERGSRPRGPTCRHTQGVPADLVAARVRAVALVDAVQGQDHDAAVAELTALSGVGLRHGWDDVAFLASVGLAVDTLVSGDVAVRHAALAGLVAQADVLGPAQRAVALAFSAVVSTAQDDGAGTLADAAAAVVLAEDGSLPALERCLALVIAAAAYNGLSLWELVDELYTRATALLPSCEEPVLAPTVAVNRVLVRLEWAAALLEVGDEDEALRQLGRAREAAVVATALGLREALWRSEVAAVLDLVPVVEAALRGRPVVGDAGLDAHRAVLVAAGDVEVLPLLDAFEALALLRGGDPARARRLVDGQAGHSTSTSSRSFPVWARAQVLAHGVDHPALDAQTAYARAASGKRWTARRAVLAAARSRVESERLTSEHAALARDVLLDPLTGLANRRRFDTWLGTVPVHDHATALLLVDLDGFKQVNDAFGHATGDEVLRRVARLVANHVRPVDLALRLGGDEFAVVLAGQEGDPLANADRVVESLRRTAEARVRAIREAVAMTDWDRIASGLEVRLSIGVGVAVLRGGSSGAAERLYRETDTALYADKGQVVAADGPQESAAG